MLIENSNTVQHILREEVTLDPNTNSFIVAEHQNDSKDVRQQVLTPALDQLMREAQFADTDSHEELKEAQLPLSSDYVAYA